MTFILGLTGSIGMGKSTTAAIFRKLGVPVHDSDACVHALYRGKAVPLIAAAFPDVVVDGVVDRQRLGAHVLGNAAAMKKLEAIVHPMVWEEEQAFIDQARRDDKPLVVIDAPLLLETDQHKRCDAILVVSAPFEVQKKRVLSRPGMTEEKFRQILARQMGDAEKRQRADFIIDTSAGLATAETQVKTIMEKLQAAA